MKKLSSRSITDVFFDLDHTLWDFEKNSALAFETLIQEQYPELDVQLFLERYVPINRSFWLQYQNNQISQADLRLGRLRTTLETFDIRAEVEKLEYMSERYIELLPQNNHLFDGALEVLEYLKDQYRLHIITNGFAQVQRRKLENAQIASYFETVTDSENAGFKKPDARIFEFAVNQARARYTSSVMIGDCLDADVNGALKCGMQAIWFAPEAQPLDAYNYRIQNLTEIKTYL